MVDLVPDIVSNPPSDCYDALKAALLKQFKKTPVEDMEEMLSIKSMGDKDPIQMLRYLRSLCASRDCLCVRAVLVRLLPDNVREQCSHIEDLDKLAERAHSIIKSTNHTFVNSIGLQEMTLVDTSVPPPGVSSTTVAAVRSAPTTPQGPSESRQSWCRAHQKWGDAAYSCNKPSTCPMRNRIKPRQQAGNGTAGRR